MTEITLNKNSKTYHPDNPYTVVERAALQCNDLKKGLDILSKYEFEKVRLMSFAMTIDQIKNRSKFVTRRHGSKHIKEGDVLLACEKIRGVKAIDRMHLAFLRVKSVRRELLTEIKRSDVVLEGFPNMSVDEFVNFYLKGNTIPRNLLPTLECTRIRFDYEIMI